MNRAAMGPELELTCHPGKQGHKLVFDYTLLNRGNSEVYVMQATPAVDPSTRATRANEQAACVVLREPGDAVVGKFVAPPAAGQRAAVSVVPLAIRLAPGEMLNERLEVAEPLAETGPFLPDLKLRDYEVVDIEAVVFAIGYWATGAKGTTAIPTPYAPGLYNIMGGQPASAPAVVSQRFTTRGLHILKRNDRLHRALAS